MNTIIDFFKWVVTFNDSQPYIDLVVIVLVIAGGFFAKKYFAWSKVPMVFMTLVVGTFFVGAYLVSMKISGTLVRADAVKYFISYAIATSFYELILSWFIEWMRGLADKFKTKKDQP